MIQAFTNPRCALVLAVAVTIGGCTQAASSPSPSPGEEPAVTPTDKSESRCPPVATVELEVDGRNANEVARAVLRAIKEGDRSTLSALASDQTRARLATTEGCDELLEWAKQPHVLTWGDRLDVHYTRSRALVAYGTVRKHRAALVELQRTADGWVFETLDGMSEKKLGALRRSIPTPIGVEGDEAIVRAFVDELLGDSRGSITKVMHAHLQAWDGDIRTIRAEGDVRYALLMEVSTTQGIAVSIRGTGPHPRAALHLRELSRFEPTAP